MQIFTYLCMSVTACTVVVEVCCISDAGYDFVQACHKQKGAEKPIQEDYTIGVVLATLTQIFSLTHKHVVCALLLVTMEKLQIFRHAFS